MRFFLDSALADDARKVREWGLLDGIWLSAAAAETADTPHTASGTVTFTDVDLSDDPTSSFGLTSLTPTLANGYVLTAAQQAALVDAFSIDPASFSSVGVSASTTSAIFASLAFSAPAPPSTAPSTASICSATDCGVSDACSSSASHSASGSTAETLPSCAGAW